MNAAASFRKLCDLIGSDATYQVSDVRSLCYNDKRASSMAEHVGMESSDDWRYAKLTAKNIRRLIALAKQIEVPVPNSVTLAQAKIEENSKWHCFSRGDETLCVWADWGDAASRIFARWNDGEEFGTQYQVADARHSPYWACLLVADSSD